MILKFKYILILIVFQFLLSCNSDKREDAMTVKMEFTLDDKSVGDAALVPTNNPVTNDISLVYQLTIDQTYHLQDMNKELKNLDDRKWYVLDVNQERKLLNSGENTISFSPDHAGLYKIALCYMYNLDERCAERFIHVRNAVKALTAEVKIQKVEEEKTKVPEPKISVSKPLPKTTPSIHTENPIEIKPTKTEPHIIVVEPTPKANPPVDRTPVKQATQKRTLLEEGRILPLNNETCIQENGKTLARGTMRLSADKEIRLKGASLYASKEGKIILTLNGPNGEHGELSKSLNAGLNAIRFSEWPHLIMKKGETWSLEFKGQDGVKLFDLNNCVNAAGSDLRPMNNLFLFNLTYYN